MKPPRSSAPPALKTFGAHLSAGVVATVLTAVAGGIFLVAGSYALFAELETFFSPAASAAFTALAYAVVMTAIAVIAPAVIRSSAGKAAAKAPPARPALTTETVSLIAQIGMVLIGGFAEAVLARRSARRDAPKSRKR